MQQQTTIHFSEGSFYAGSLKLADQKARWYWDTTGNMEIHVGPVHWTQAAYQEMSRRVMTDTTNAGLSTSH